MYTKEQKAAIKREFTKDDRATMAQMYGAITSRLIANGLRRVSLKRALEIAEALQRKSVIAVLLPELDNKARTSRHRVA